MLAIIAEARAILACLSSEPGWSDVYQDVGGTPYRLNSQASIETRALCGPTAIKAMLEKSVSRRIIELYITSLPKLIQQRGHHLFPLVVMHLVMQKLFVLKWVPAKIQQYRPLGTRQKPVHAYGDGVLVNHLYR